MEQFYMQRLKNLFILLIYRLAEVGVLEDPKLQGKYDTGQV